MALEIKMPALSPTMEEGTLAKWLVKEGDKVAAGDILAEIETDKATMEFEAVDEGTISQILVAEGTDEVKVGAVIAIMAAEGEDAGRSGRAGRHRAGEDHGPRSAARRHGRGDARRRPSLRDGRGGRRISGRLQGHPGAARRVRGEARDRHADHRIWLCRHRHR